MLGKMVCAVIGHRVNRRRVKFDEQQFRTHCRRCEVELIRDRDGWRRLNAADDGPDDGQAPLTL